MNAYGMALVADTDERVRLVADALWAMGTAPFEVDTHETLATVRAVLAGEPASVAAIDAARRAVARMFIGFGGTEAEAQADLELVAQVRSALAKALTVEQAVARGMHRPDAEVMAYLVHERGVA